MLRAPFLWLLSLLYLGLAMLYASVTPAFEKPDESWHFAFSMYVAETASLPVQYVVGREHKAEQEGSQPPLYYTLHAVTMRLAGLSELEEGYLLLTEVNPHYGGKPGAWRENVNQYLHVPCGMRCHDAIQGVMLGRGISIVAGWIALVAAWQFLALTFPQSPSLPPIVVALMALNPQFLHIASSVSNDMMTVAWVNVTLLLGIQWMLKPRWLTAIAAGATAGLALLSKMSGLSVGVVMGGAMAVMAWRGGRWRAIGSHLILLGAAALGLSGWWFVRNLRLYGEPTATAVHLRVYGTPPAPVTLERVITEWRAIADSYWASFGWGALNLDQGVYGLARWVALGLFLLTMLWVSRSWRRWPFISRGATLLLAVLVLVVAVLLARWMRLTVAPLGRLLFPAALPIAFALGAGVASLPWRRVASSLGTIVVGGMVLLDGALALLLIRPAYAPPALLLTVPNEASDVRLHFGSSIMLEGVALPSGPIQPGSILPVTLYWRNLTPIAATYSVSVKLLGYGDALIARYDSMPAGGRLPTPAWPAGQLIPDRYWLVIPSDPPVPVQARLQVNLFDAVSQETLPVVDATGNEVVPHIAQVVIRNDTPTTEERYAFRVGVKDVTLERQRATIDFEWQVGQPLDADYRAFLHLVSAVGTPPLGEPGDFDPLGGWLPTSEWRAGDRLADQAAISLDRTLPSGEYLLIMGLYDLTTLQTVPSDGAETATIVAHLVWDGTTWRVHKVGP